MDHAVVSVQLLFHGRQYLRRILDQVFHLPGIGRNAMQLIHAFELGEVRRATSFGGMGSRQHPKGARQNLRDLFPVIAEN